MTPITQNECRQIDVHLKFHERWIAIFLIRKGEEEQINLESIPAAPRSLWSHQPSTPGGLPPPLLLLLDLSKGRRVWPCLGGGQRPRRRRLQWPWRHLGHVDIDLMVVSIDVGWLQLANISRHRLWVADFAARWHWHVVGYSCPPLLSQACQPLKTVLMAKLNVGFFS